MSSQPPTLAETLAAKGRRFSDDGRFTFEEVQLASRNRGIPIEALRYEITPSGLHYLLTRFDVPDVNEMTWRLQVGGLVERPLLLSLNDLKRMPRVTEPVTMECAGNGRALVQPRPIGQPWILDAVSTARWTGARLALRVGCDSRRVRTRVPRDRRRGLCATAHVVLDAGRDGK